MSKPCTLVRCLAAAGLAAAACATPEPQASREPEHQRVARAQRDLAEDPVVQAHVAGVEAARAREEGPMLVDELELRLREEYIDEHQMRVTARVPFNAPPEVRAQREVLAAETHLAISRLEEVSLERRSELCFPSVEALAARDRNALYADYLERRQELLVWNDEWRRAGTIDELRGARFELESRIRLASWEPQPVPQPERVFATLPAIEPPEGELIRDPAIVRDTVRRHHPSVGVRRATAERFRALADRARARNQPRLKFVDVSYEHRTDDSDNGVGGQLAFEIPLGGERANAGRYEALIRQEDGEARGAVAEQVTRSLRALDELHAFEARSPRWRDLLRLADEAEEIADRWWQGRVARPSDVAALLDDAFRARSTVLDARERAGNADCALLALTGVGLDAWPRQPPGP